MRLDVTTKEVTQELANTKGWFRAAKTRPVWDVILRLHLSEEERAIINKRNLWKSKFHLRKFPPEHFEGMTSEERSLIGHVTDQQADLHWFVNGYQGKKSLIYPTVSCYTPQAAKQFEQHFVEDVLPRIKALIADSAEGRSGTRSYEA
jgi:hypothetical protein